MLTESPAIKNALVKGHLESMVRRTENGDQASRFTSVVDEFGEELGAVTGRYQLVQTADIVAAFDLECERKGYVVEGRSGFYRNGRAKVILDIRNRAMRRDGGNGTITPMVYLENGLGGLHRLVVGTGANIGRCGNGMWFGDIVSKDTRKHTSGLDLGAIVRGAVDKLDQRIERDMAWIEAARKVRFDFAGDVCKAIGEDTPERLRRDFRHVISSNRSLEGDTVWAMAQSITELSTHYMRTRQSDGSHVWAADDYTRRQLDRLNREYHLVG
jgi:hypothetical protein